MKRVLVGFKGLRAEPVVLCHVSTSLAQGLAHARCLWLQCPQPVEWE